MKMKFKWWIDEDESDEYGPLDLLDAEKDPEKKWFEISLKNDFGIKPIKVNEGQEIHITLMSELSDYRMNRCFYGYDGYSANVGSIPG